MSLAGVMPGRMCRLPQVICSVQLPVRYVGLAI